VARAAPVDPVTKGVRLHAMTAPADPAKVAPAARVLPAVAPTDHPLREEKVRRADPTTDHRTTGKAARLHGPVKRVVPI
jgi:hypothetical protein